MLIFVMSDELEAVEEAVHPSAPVDVPHQSEEMEVVEEAVSPVSFVNFEFLFGKDWSGT